MNAELFAINSLAANSSDAAQVAARASAALKRIGQISQTATLAAADAADGRAIVATPAAYAKSARDTFDMASTDAGMALLLMGGVQSDFTTLEGQLNALVENADRSRARTYQGALVSIDAARIGLIAAAALTTLLAFVAAAAGIRAISRPVIALTAVMRRMASSTNDVAITGCERRDEPGAMARALEVFREDAIERGRLRREQESEHDERFARTQTLDAGVKVLEREEATILASFVAAAAELDDAAGSMSARAGETAERSATAIATADQTSADVQTVTAAAEQLTAPIGEIVGQVARSSAVAPRALSSRPVTPMLRSRVSPVPRSGSARW